ncbi:alpha/beta hydrolase [Sphingoaurantiacus capsulatus]|uniref:Alpha/beta hydrolase n=1 Tax=Sphingoaurantiacus capsulatus TaxID=1771310 RepID=A0ABV7X9G8_9SPHN
MDDERLHSEIRAILARRATLALPAYSSGTPEAARNAFAASQAALPRDRGARMAVIVNESVCGDAGPIRIRRYRPEGEVRGTLVYFHGGGWVFGTLDAFDPVCRETAATAGAEVISVDYRLSPEATYPEPLDDAYRALCAVAGDGPLAVMGDSAGGNLAAACALRARDEKGPRIDLQILLYPITDHRSDRASYAEFGGGGYLLSSADMDWYWGHYAPDAARRDEPYASPLRAATLAGLPPAIVVIAGCDPLHDEGVEYAARLTEAEVEVDLREYPDMTHGFFTLTGLLGTADDAARSVGAAIRERFASR